MGVILINNTNHWFLPLITCSENTQKKVTGTIKIINAKNDNVLFEYTIPEIRGGDFDQRKKASKKAIKNLIKHIKTTNFLES